MENKIEERLNYVEIQITNLLFMAVGLISLHNAQKGDIIGEINFWLGIIFFGIGLFRFTAKGVQQGRLFNFKQVYKQKQQK